MKLKLNKKSLKNLSKDAQILPGEMTPQIGGGITAAANCTASQFESGCNHCNTENVCGSGNDDCEGVTYFCGWSDNCVSGAWSFCCP
jgi:hypothetical protein